MDTTITPGDERLIRNEAEQFAVTFMESKGLNLSDGVKPVTRWQTGETLNTDETIRLVQGAVIAAIEADRAQRPNPLKVLEDAIQEARDEFEEVQYHYAWYSPEYTTAGDRLKALEDVYDMLKAGASK